MKKVSCSVCSGRKKLGGNPCPECRGKGFVMISRVPKTTQKERSLRRAEARKRRYDLDED